MLIEVDNWTKDVLWNTSDYIVKPPFKIVDHKPYVNVEDLVQAISDLTDEVDRQYEVISKMGKDVQIYFKGNQLPIGVRCPPIRTAPGTARRGSCVP